MGLFKSIIFKMIIWSIILCGLSTLVRAATSEYTGKLLLISMDGFRHDYLDRVKHKPNFDRMASEGVKAPYVNAPFTTLTFPTHYTLVTGLYEEDHGIVANEFYDPNLNETFEMGTGAKEAKWWSGGEPIWTTARKQGKRSAAYFWPGSEAEVDNIRPNFWKPYRKSTVFRDRVDEVVHWFVNESVDVTALYFYEPDQTGHDYGPYSDEVLSKIEDLDAVLGYLLQKMEDNNILDTVNIILTSDHGMTSLDPDNRVIKITDYFTQPGSSYDDLVERLVARLALCHVYPRANKTSEVYQTLKDAHPNMTVYLKKDIPERYHYKMNDRIPPILIVADEGWAVSDYIPPGWSMLGGHGYDNELMSMKPFFLARGPNFKTNYKTEPFDTVDIYPLMCEILGLTPAPNNGFLTVVKAFVQGTVTPSGRPQHHDTRTPPSGSAANFVISKLFVFCFLMLVHL